MNKHYSNQSKAIVICDHKSDKTRSVAHVNKAYLVWLMFRVLSNQHYQHRTNQKLRSWANAVFQNRGVCGQAVPSFPSPSPVIPFLFSGPNFSRRTRAETLATQAKFQLLLTLKNAYQIFLLLRKNWLFLTSSMNFEVHMTTVKAKLRRSSSVLCKVCSKRLRFS